MVQLTSRLPSKRNEVQALKITVFNITKYNESMKRLESRKAPKYIIEAYENGFGEIVNSYYREKIEKLKSGKSVIEESYDYINELAKTSKHVFINEALEAGDAAFLKKFLQMTNIDIFTGQRLPNDYSKMIKQGFKFADDTFKDVLNKIK